MAKEQEKSIPIVQKNTFSGSQKRRGISQEVLKSAKKQVKKYAADLEYLKDR